MAVSQSNSPNPIRLWFRGLLNSNHALLICLSLAAVFVFALARDAYPIVAYGAFVLLTIITGGVVGRFLWKGPERDPLPPSVTFSDNQFQILNIPPADAENLIRFAVQHRRDLPTPSGIVQGHSSDPSAIRLLDESAARFLQSAATDQSSDGPQHNA